LERDTAAPQFRLRRHKAFSIVRRICDPPEEISPDLADLILSPASIASAEVAVNMTRGCRQRPSCATIAGGLIAVT
jgi:hypothetical protein